MYDSQLFTFVSNSTETAEELLTTLKVYGDRRTLNSLTIQFYNRTQGVYDKIRHFSHRVNKAFTSLKAGHIRNGTDPVPESLLPDQFIARLRSDSLGLHLGSRTDVIQQRSGRRHCESGSCVSPHCSGSRDDIVSSEIRLEARSQLPPVTSEQQEESRRRHRRNDMRCHCCQQPDHIARDCRAPTPTPTGNNNPQ
ncbi:hypothetical protein RRG08_007746 [Elysia crispata]|uniref:CCHC-type domain-containing protein n=1 Tax=Elysia crispata TaxID=231223 RepID=A0AAE1A465_9GAST|nr:hypothetical protein RRG08_007746 [Elysia crispata]